jgi:hypothetical protein
LFLASILLFSGTAGAQSASPYPDETQLAPGGTSPADSSSVFAAALPSPFPEASSSSLDSAITPVATGVYVPPTQAQRFRNYTWNALGPVAFAGSSFAAAIDQGFNFPHEWGQGADAYGARVASNLGISLVTATAQYSLAEAFHEDTAYYRCACKGFFPRFCMPLFPPWPRAVEPTAITRFLLRCPSPPSSALCWQLTAGSRATMGPRLVLIWACTT